MLSGGARPSNLGRRGAVYFVRFRIPSDLVERLGRGELQKSLHTRELGEARRRCRDASTWYAKVVEALRGMPDPSRAQLEAAAARFFERLKLDVDQRRPLGGQPLREAVRQQVHLSEERIRELDVQLVANDFDGATERLAEAMLGAIRTTLPELDSATALLAKALAARTARQQMFYFIHQLTAPASRFSANDELFDATPPPTPRGEARLALRSQPTVAESGPSLAEAAGEYLRKQALRGLGQSQIDEVRRALGWLQEKVGTTRPITAVTKDELRSFRDDLERLDVTLRGRNGPFKDRLTNVREKQIKSVTSKRYWQSTQAFFLWCAEEGFVKADPSAGLKILARKGETKATPEAFSPAEVKAFLSTPLYAGYASERSPTKPGASRVRGERWWAGVLPLFTGLRAGELSQLLPGDFVFDGTIPHLKVREEDEGGRRVKTTKNAASVRDVPLASSLMDLGLRQFVERQADRYPKQRVFRSFRLGARGRTSDGMTKFWGDYLKRFDLWKPGRATHVARHTVVARLRALGVPEEDISTFVGHSRGTMTSKYGGAYPLERKFKTAEALDHGFDAVTHLGGPYDPKAHG